jgi:hypothetical protein
MADDPKGLNVKALAEALVHELKKAGAIGSRLPDPPPAADRPGYGAGPRGPSYPRRQWPPMPMPWPRPPGFSPEALWAWFVSWLINAGVPIPPGPGMAEALRFAVTRDDFWHHLADATGDVFQQAANASRGVGDEFDPYHHYYWGHSHQPGSGWGPPWAPWDPSCPPFDGKHRPIEIEKLRADLASWPEEDRNRICWAVQMSQQYADYMARKRGKDS